MSQRLRDRVKDARAAQAEGGAASPGAAAAAGQDLVRGVIADLRRMRNEFELALGRSADPDQLIRDAVTEIRNNPELLREDVDPQTILGAVMTCAQLRLRPGVMGQAWILPFWNERRHRREATFVIGYRGLAKLAHQSGLIRGLAARTVFERDTFNFTSEHDGDKMCHKPNLLAPDRGRPLLYYARATLPDGGYQITEPTNHALMLHHRTRHVKITTGPWFDDRGVPNCGFEAMAWKTEVKRLAKLLPLDTHFGQAVEADEGVRYDTNPKADVDKVTEHEREAAIPGESWESPAPPADGLDWSDVAGAKPAPPKEGTR